MLPDPRGAGPGGPRAAAGAGSGQEGLRLLSAGLATSPKPRCCPSQGGFPGGSGMSHWCRGPPLPCEAPCAVTGAAGRSHGELTWTRRCEALAGTSPSQQTEWGVSTAMSQGPGAPSSPERPQTRLGWGNRARRGSVRAMGTCLGALQHPMGTGTATATPITRKRSPQSAPAAQRSPSPMFWLWFFPKKLSPVHQVPPAAETGHVRGIGHQQMAQTQQEDSPAPLTAWGQGSSQGCAIPGHNIFDFFSGKSLAEGQFCPLLPGPGKAGCPLIAAPGRQAPYPPRPRWLEECSCSP